MWHLPNEFNNHTMRLDGFHSVALFHRLVSSGVIVVYVILILVCMHLSPLIKCCWKAIETCCLWFDIDVLIWRQLHLEETSKIVC